MLIAGQCTPHFLFGLAEKKTGRARSKRKERFGGSVCAGADLLPPAGDGWRSLAAVRDGNALPLGKPPARGSIGIPSASLPAAAHAPVKNSQRQRKEKQLDATTTPTRPAPSATGRQYLPRRRVKRARRRAQIGAGTDTPTPVRTEGRCTGVRPSGLFFWTVHGPFSFPQDGKENGGCIPAGQAPLAGASPPWPLFSGPHHSRGRAPKTGAPPLYFSSNTDTYTVPLTSNPSLAFT